MANTSLLPDNSQYHPQVRKIRQVLDPSQLRDPYAQVAQGVDNITQGQRNITDIVIQKRLIEQQKKEAEAQRKRQLELMAAQRRAANSTAARNQKYADGLNSYIASTPLATYDAANSAPNHSAAYQRALGWANEQVKNPSRDWTRDCQMFARTAVGAKAFGTTALNAWQSTPEEHRHYTYPPPPGTIAYYANPRNPGAGHAVFVGDNGKVYSTDIKRTGKIDIVNWDTFKTTWGMQYLGWIDSTPSGNLPVQG